MTVIERRYFSDIKSVVDNNDEQQIKKICADSFRDVVIEIKEIPSMRNVQMVSSLKAVVSEQNNKWNAICSRCEAAGFDILNKDAVIKYAEQYMFKEKLFKKTIGTVDGGRPPYGLNLSAWVFLPQSGF